MAITALEIQDMVNHWLHTPTNGYHGSDYGCDPLSLLQNPQNIGVADAFLAKLKRDVPILTALPANAVSLYSVSRGVDGLDIFIEIAGISIQIPNLNAN